MARRAPSRCTRCTALATRGGRCDDHQVKPWANPSANTRALTPADRARFRRAVLADWDYQCGWCRAPATEADHITPIGLGGAPHDWAYNGMAMCSECHEEKTIEDNRAIRRARQPQK